MDATTLAARVMQRAATLGAISEEPDRLTRRFCTPALAEATATVAAWMSAAGMNVRLDNVGNVIGRYRGAGERTLLLGSHLDSVRDAGRYDGPLGVLVALAAIESLAAQQGRLPFAIEVLGFADEEGLRFGTAYLGSKAYAGSFDANYLTLLDSDGISMAQAIRDAGGDPDALDADRRAPTGLIGYCEVHIEQGPVLEAENLPVGVVTAIAGQSRFLLRFGGQAGHAGTVPMALRHDALAGAAEFILAAETLARQEDGLVATVGRIAAEPGAVNVIPGAVTISLDVRHPTDAQRVAACDELSAQTVAICARRGLQLDWSVLQQSGSVDCSARLSDLLAVAITDLALPLRRLPSGAGHDGVPLSALTEVAMLFVRCKGGISHNPAESVTQDDVATAIAVLNRFLQLLAVKESANEPL